MKALADLAKLQANLGGVKNMQRPPDAMFVVDLKTEDIAVKEAKRLRIPIIGLVDTNCDPDGIQYVIPGNDDAMKSCAVITGALGDVIRGGRAAWQQVEEERVRKETEERARKEAEEAAKREAEEQARVEAEAAEAAAQAERVEERQAEAVASRKAQTPVERVRRRHGPSAPRADGRRGPAAQARPERQARAEGQGQAQGQGEAEGRSGGRGAPAPAAETRAPSARSSHRGRPRRRAEAPAPRRRPPPRRRRMADITAAMVKELRDKTGAGMMDCKKALQETEGDVDKAVEALRVKLGDKALKLGGRETSEGTVQSYIHANAKIGVLVEVGCNTDFVARNPDFVDFAKAVAMHVAAIPSHPLRLQRRRPGERA